MRFLLDHDVPDEIQYSLVELGHTVSKLREVLPTTTPDEQVLEFAHQQSAILVTCNRDDFLAIAARSRHSGLVVLIRRRTRAQERAALVRLLDKAGESGLEGNVNFA